ncbi:hypothetical protein XENORESO_004011 [Xenotaenia resolanae]|uniref:Uncharacterized protein n=1 Tax=Xenotaenia resolanae TaxID=208358 RepID=A0ABV0WIT6_9TELE
MMTPPPSLAFCCLFPSTIVPLTRNSVPHHADEKHSHIMMLPPPCFTKHGGVTKPLTLKNLSLYHWTREEAPSSTSLQLANWTSYGLLSTITFFFPLTWEIVLESNPAVNISRTSSLTCLLCSLVFMMLVIL